MEKKREYTCNQGSYPFSETSFQNSDWFFQDSKIHINPFTPMIYILILLTVCHTFHIFYLRFPELAAFIQDFPVLENAWTFQFFQDRYKPWVIIISS